MERLKPKHRVIAGQTGFVPQSSEDGITWYGYSTRKVLHEFLTFENKADAISFCESQRILEKIEVVWESE